MTSFTGAANTFPFRHILITGGNGFVGRYLARALHAFAGSTARITLASRETLVDSDYERVAFDLRDAASVDAAIDIVRPDLVIHLAAQASVGEALANAASTWALNLGGSLALGEAIARTCPDCTTLYVSSAEVYGLTFNQDVAHEASPLRPQSAYARSKAAAEAMFDDVLPRSARLIVARPSNHSGPGQDERFVIPAFAGQIARIEQRGFAGQIRVGNLDAERDFLDVRDVVSAYLALLEAAPALPMRSTFNVASGQTISVANILSKLRSMSEMEMEVLADPARMRPSAVARAAVDATALRAMTGWSPVHSFDAMLADVLAEQRARSS